MRSAVIECCKFYFHEGGCSELICEDWVSQPLFVFLSSLYTYTTCKKTFHLSVLILYGIKETWMPEIQVLWDMWNTKPVMGSWPLWCNLKATPFSWPNLAHGAKVAHKAQLPLVILRIKPLQLTCAEAVSLVSLLDITYSLWDTLKSCYSLFIFKCCLPLLQYFTQGSSDFLFCVNLYIQTLSLSLTHTQVLFSSVPWYTTATFLANCLLKWKYL